MILGKCPNPVTQCDRKCSFCVSSKYKNILRAPEVAQQAKKCTAMPGDLCSVSGAHMVEGENQLPWVFLPTTHTRGGGRMDMNKCTKNYYTFTFNKAV